MKVLILAGGKGTRLSEETDVRPKPMVEIGGRPILWHIMKGYSRYGHNDFVLLLGYKGYLIKEYFANYCLHQSDVTLDLSKNSMEVHNNSSEPWRITLLDTGLETMTGGRIKRSLPFIKDTFLLTYGDGVSDVDINALVKHHKSSGKLMTMTAVQPDGRFGTFESTPDGRVTRFLEKPRGDGSWINGGFFVCEPEVLDYVRNGDETILERDPMEALAQEGQLGVFSHSGFWKCMDTLRDKTELNEMWNSGMAKWKTW